MFLRLSSIPCGILFKDYAVSSYQFNVTKERSPCDANNFFLNIKARCRTSIKVYKTTFFNLTTLSLLILLRNEEPAKDIGGSLTRSYFTS